MSPHPISDEQLVAYAHDELGSEPSASVAAHTAACPRCSRFVATFRLVANTLEHDDSRQPPAETVEKAYAILKRDRVQPRPFPFTLHPTHIFAAAMLGLLALMLGAAIGIAAQDVPPESALYPIKNAVNVFQTTVSDTWRSLGGSQSPTQSTPNPTKSQNGTPSPSHSPAISNPEQKQTPPGQFNAPPGQTRTPPGKVNTPPGQEKTPPGQEKTPPGQVKTPPGQVRTPTKVNEPPGQVKTPPGQMNTPPGQVNTPGSPNVPPGQNNPPGQSDPPGSKNDSPGQGNGPPKDDKGSSDQQKNK